MSELGRIAITELVKQAKNIDSESVAELNEDALAIFTFYASSMSMLGEYESAKRNFGRREVVAAGGTVP